MNHIKSQYLTAGLVAAGLWACGDSGGGGSITKGDASGGGFTADMGSGGEGGSGGAVTGGSGGAAGSGGSAGSGGTGGTGGVAGSGGSGGTAGSGGMGGQMTVDAGTTDSGLEPDSAAVDPDGGVDVICNPCEADDDCGGGTCVDSGAVRFCSIRCAQAEECGAGLVCDTVAGQEGTWCLPSVACDAPPACDDADSDGYGEGAGCLGPDCDDAADDVHPGVDDGCDGRNNDCDENTDEDYVAESCGEGACAAESACQNGQIIACAPGAAVGDDSVCNGVDDDCDGEVDEAFVAQTCGQGVCGATSSCENGAEVACVPGAAELADDTTCNGVDEDCNGEEDEDFLGEACGLGACAVTGRCEGGAPVCIPNERLSADDASCNGVDDDCDGDLDEDFVHVTSCGVGECRRDGFCDAELGAESCTAGAPLDIVDDTCDGIDDDCDGFIDEECGDNNFGFRIENLDADSLDVAVIYHQTASPTADLADTQPRVLNLWMRYGQSLALVPDNLDTDDDERATRGSALLLAEKGMTVIERGENVLRIVVLSASNTNRIAPDAVTNDAEIAILHFTLAGAAPHTLEWIENNPDLMILGTTLAPVEAQNVLSLSNASFGL